MYLGSTSQLVGIAAGRLPPLAELTLQGTRQRWTDGDSRGHRLL